MSTAQATKERPIEFSGPTATEDIRAIISGAKTQHRLLVDPQPQLDKAGNWVRVNRRGVPESIHRETTTYDGPLVSRESSCIAPPECIFRLWRAPASVGQNLWVRERCRAEELKSGLDGVRYAADDAFKPIENSQQASDRWAALDRYGKGQGKPVPSIHMPRWASRLTLRVTGLRVEQLHEITEDDAKAEGVGPVDGSHSDGFCGKWIRSHGIDSWDGNPWVWVVEFERVES